MSEGLFDLSHEYDEMLQRGLALSGENKDFFASGRIRDMRAQLPPGFEPLRILDFGCGIGGTARALAEVFPRAEVVGVDSAEKALAHARERADEARVTFRALQDFSVEGSFDLCHVNGVFHHIDPKDRLRAVRLIHRALRPGGRFSFFENNPWNPGTRLVMSRIPFDRDAKLLSARKARRLLEDGGFRASPPRFLFYFPRPLAFLRGVEPYLTGLPLGAQYHVHAVKDQ